MRGCRGCLCVCVCVCVCVRVCVCAAAAGDFHGVEKRSPNLAATTNKQTKHQPPIIRTIAFPSERCAPHRGDCAKRTVSPQLDRPLPLWAALGCAASSAGVRACVRARVVPYTRRAMHCTDWLVAAGHTFTPVMADTSKHVSTAPNTCA